MASLIIFICLCAFMFAAGYQWRKMREHPMAARPDTAPAPTREALWNDMLRKI